MKVRVVLASVGSDCDHRGNHWVGKGSGCDRSSAMVGWGWVQLRRLIMTSGQVEF